MNLSVKKKIENRPTFGEVMDCFVFDSWCRLSTHWYISYSYQLLSSSCVSNWYFVL